MYLWVVIAIFISALAALSSSLRPDIKDIYINTRAETETTQIYTLHRAALKYANDHSDKEGEITVSSDLVGYLPYGFDSGNFVSMSYCLNTDGVNIPNDCLTEEPVDPNALVDPSNPPAPNLVSDGSCCTKSGVSRYIITYGSLPLKWTNVHTGKPKVELLDAMKDKVGYVDGLGYSVTKTIDHPYMGDGNVFDYLNSDMGVVTQGTIPYSPIPQYIINHNADFSTGGKCSAGNYCLVYISRISH